MFTLTQSEWETFKRRYNPEVFTKSMIDNWIEDVKEELIKSESGDKLDEPTENLVKGFKEELASFQKVIILSNPENNSLQKGLIRTEYFIRPQQVEWLEEEIIKGEDNEIEKSRYGRYTNTELNRKLGRVGVEFGKKGEKEEESKESKVKVGNTVSIGKNGTKFKISSIENGEATLEALEEVPGASKVQKVSISRLEEFGTFGLMKEELKENDKKSFEVKNVHHSMEKDDEKNNWIKQIKEKHNVDAKFDKNGPYVTYSGDKQDVRNVLIDHYGSKKEAEENHSKHFIDKPKEVLENVSNETDVNKLKSLYQEYKSKYNDSVDKRPKYSTLETSEMTRYWKLMNIVYKRIKEIENKN